MSWHLYYMIVRNSQFFTKLIHSFCCIQLIFKITTKHWLSFLGPHTNTPYFSLFVPVNSFILWCFFSFLTCEHRAGFSKIYIHERFIVSRRKTKNMGILGKKLKKQFSHILFFHNAMRQKKLISSLLNIVDLVSYWLCPQKIHYTIWNIVWVSKK